jgi:hypothetical protein
MAWAWVQGASVASSGNASLAYANNVASGTKLIAVVAADISVTPATFTAAGTAMTQAALINGTTGGGVTLAVYFLDTTAGMVGTKPTVTMTGVTGSGGTDLLIAEVSGLVAGNTTAAALDGTAATKQVSSAATVAQPAYTSTALNEFLITCSGDNGGPQTWTDPAGYQGATAGPGSAGAVKGINNNANSDIELAYKNSANGPESGTWSYTGTTTGSAYIVVAFKVPAGAAATPFFPARQPARSRIPSPYSLGGAGLVNANSVQQVP